MNKKPVEIKIPNNNGLNAKLNAYTNNRNYVNKEIVLSEFIELIVQLKIVTKEHYYTDEVNDLNVRIECGLTLGTYRLKLFKIENQSNTSSSKSTSNYIKSIDLNESENQVVRRLIVNSVENVLSVFLRCTREIMLKQSNDVNVNTYLMNLRQMSNALIKYFEESITLYLFSGKRSYFNLCANLLSNGSFTYRSICFVIQNFLRCENVDEMTMKHIEYQVPSRNTDNSLTRSAYQIGCKDNLCINVSLEKSLKFKIFKDNEMTSNKVSNHRRETWIEKSDIESMRIASVNQLETVALKLGGDTKDKRQIEPIDEIDNNSNNNSDRSQSSSIKLKLFARSPITPSVIKTPKKNDDLQVNDQLRSPRANQYTGINFNERINALLSSSNSNEHETFVAMMDLVKHRDFNNVILSLSDKNRKIADAYLTAKEICNSLDDLDRFRSLVNYLLSDNFNLIRTKFYCQSIDDNELYNVTIGLIMIECIMRDLEVPFLNDILSLGENSVIIWKRVYERLMNLKSTL